MMDWQPIHTKPATFHRWVWFWQVCRFKVAGWKVEDRTFLKARVWRETRFDDYIYGDLAVPIGLSTLLTGDPLEGYGGIDRSDNPMWRNRHNG